MINDDNFPLSTPNFNIDNSITDYFEYKIKSKPIELNKPIIENNSKIDSIYFLEDSAEFSFNDKNISSGNGTFDLHSFTQLGAEQALRRICTNLDRSHQQVVKINVGVGIHSANNERKLPNIVKKVAHELNLPDPIQHANNPGFLLLIIPPISSSK